MKTLPALAVAAIALFSLARALSATRMSRSLAELRSTTGPEKVLFGSEQTVNALLIYKGKGNQRPPVKSINLFMR